MQRQQESGKTTCFNGLVKTHQGSIKVDGKLITENNINLLQKYACSTKYFFIRLNYKG